jgi:hypothetical protein
VQGCLRRLIGERELGLVRKSRPRYKPIHGLRLEWGGLELFAFHGHQAARYFAGRNYDDFLQEYQARPRRIRDEKDMDDAGRLYRTERRIYRACLRRGIVAIFGHTGRALFESRTDYDDLRLSIERLFRREAATREAEGGVLDLMLARYRRELGRKDRRERDSGLTLGAGGEGLLAPCLFNPGFVVSGSGLNFLEIEDGRIRRVRWIDDRREHAALRSRSLRLDRFEDEGLTRCVLGEANLDSVRERMDLLSREP